MSETFEILEDTYSRAYEAICKNLDENNIKYDYNGDSIYVNDHENKVTYCFSVSFIECDEYGGED